MYVPTKMNKMKKNIYIYIYIYKNQKGETNPKPWNLKVALRPSGVLLVENTEKETEGRVGQKTVIKS